MKTSGRPVVPDREGVPATFLLLAFWETPGFDDRLGGRTLHIAAIFPSGPVRRGADVMP